MISYSTEDKLQLKDGRLIDCYQRKDDNPSPAKAQLLTDNAFFLLANYEKILGDSRMFLAPIGVLSGVNVGNATVDSPVLGMYIEWWLACSESVVFEDELEPLLVWQYYGHVMSGTNHCKCVDAYGTVTTTSITGFRKAWENFLSLDKRYKHAKEKFQALSLQEVIESIQSNPVHKDADHAAAMLTANHRHRK